MSRSGYNEDYDSEWRFIMWRGAVASAIRGKRGQQFLRELVEALDTLPEKRLIADELGENGCYCAIGAVGAKRGMDMTKLNPQDAERVAGSFNISPALAREIVFINGEGHWGVENPESRFWRVRAWARRHLVEGDPK